MSNVPPTSLTVAKDALDLVLSSDSAQAIWGHATLNRLAVVCCGAEVVSGDLIVAAARRLRIQTIIVSYEDGDPYAARRKYRDLGAADGVVL
jgi:hypothetical protein